MSRTHFDGPLASGDKQAGIAGGPNVGLATLVQVLPLTNPGPGTYNYTVNLPVGSQIIDFVTDVATAFNSASSAALTVGTASLGTQFLTSVDLKTAGRAAFAPTAAQIAAYANVTAPLIATLVATGAGVAGAATLMVRYVQKG